MEPFGAVIALAVATRRPQGLQALVLSGTYVQRAAAAFAADYGARLAQIAAPTLILTPSHNALWCRPDRPPL